MHESRRLLVAGLPVVVLDDMMEADAITELFQRARRLPYTLSDIDSDATSYARHWKHELVGAEMEARLYRGLLDIAEATLPTYEPTLKRVHYNLHLYGDVQFAHTDTNGPGLTVLLYVNDQWPLSWMGETLFYENDEPVVAVVPKPGRVVIFDGRIVHRAGVQQRECFEPRISLALKCSATIVPEQRTGKRAPSR